MTKDDEDGMVVLGGEGSNLTGFEGFDWEVHKFGGTSVANAECFQRVASIVEGRLVGHRGLRRENRRLVVVVSAMGGRPKVTDLLLSTIEAAVNRDEESISRTFRTISDKHHACLEELPLDASERERLRQVIASDMSDLQDILKTVSLLKWQANRIKELVSGYGELWSTQILASLLETMRRGRRDGELQEHKFAYLDARRVITIDEEAIQSGAVCWDESTAKLRQVYQEEMAACSSEKKQALHLVMTGYVASNTQGVATTLSRDGSDYSAAIMGRLVWAHSDEGGEGGGVTIWTDVDGVLSADPRRVPAAYVLPEVSFNEAMELAYFGAKVIHPKTIQPAISALPSPICIYIRNSFRPTARGTRIFTSSTTHTDRDRCVCAFSSIDDMALVNVEGSGLVGVHGVAKRLFGTLEAVGVNVVLISQASSEHSITFAAKRPDAERAKEAIEDEFQRELQQNHISAVDVQAPCSIIAAVGDGMSDTSGVAGRFFSALGDAKINVLAISQGCSERNISAVVSMKDSTRALRAVHAAFRLSQTSVRVGIVGMNEMGASLLKLLETQRNKLRTTFEIDLQVCAVLPNASAVPCSGDASSSSSSQVVVVLENDSSGSADSITPAAYKAAMNLPSSSTLLQRDSSISFTEDPQRPYAATAESASAAAGGRSSIGKKEKSVAKTISAEDCLETLAACVLSEDCAHAVLVDCTADDFVGAMHPRWLREGLHVVTANNSALSGPLAVRQSLRDAMAFRGKSLAAQYYNEVTVGGGLPILKTIRDLLHSGDKIRRVDGILSVSVSYIMHRVAPPPGLDACLAFDQAIRAEVFGESRTTTTTTAAATPAAATKGCAFSQAVEEAMALGLMETDPVKDLDNEYTARCLMVLAKELGLDDAYDVNLIQKTSESLLSMSGSAAAATTSFVATQLDEAFQKRVEAAAAKGCVPRQVSSIDVKSRRIRISMVDVPYSHIFAISPPSCECVRFFTERHSQYPLIVQGPSAGIDATASALLAELLNLMRSKVSVHSGALSRKESGVYLA